MSRFLRSAALAALTPGSLTIGVAATWATGASALAKTVTIQAVDAPRALLVVSHNKNWPIGTASRVRSSA